MKACHVSLNENFIKYKIAHRGLHSAGVSENSLEAFRRAIDGGYGIEIDIHLLKDGQLAVVHDSNLKRVTGADVTIENLTSAELKNYPLADGQTIPLLCDVLKLIDGRAPLLIELKFGDGFDKRQADALLAQLEGYKYKDMIALQSFHPAAVRYLKKHTKAYPAGFLCSYGLGQTPFKTYMLKSLKLFGYMKGDFISYDINYLPNKYVTAKRRRGVPVLAWTVNSPEKLTKAASCADNIIFENITV